MALSSVRQKSIVDPSKGIYVEMPSIMEVRYLCDDVDVNEPREDMWHFQQRVKEIPDDFCHKNKQTSEQNIFFCLVCNCELKNLRPLKDHVTGMGNKHIRKACETKRQILGMPKEPQNAPRKKETKTERPRVDVSLRLEERLKESGSPAIGLEYISEFTNPRNPRDHPMYTCSLEGCKSAWGTSDDIFHHVQNHKHQRNFFRKMYPTDARIAGLTKDELLRKASEYEEEMGGPEAREYSSIIIVEKYDKYEELRNRPDDWSEKKAKQGLVGMRSNSNHEPLGKRRAQPQHQPRSQSQFDEAEWKDWEPPTKRRVVTDLVKDFKDALKDIHDMIEMFRGRKGDDKHSDILFHLKITEDLLSLHINDESMLEVEQDFQRMASSWSEELKALKNAIEEKTEGEDRAVKEISKLMAELEDEIKNYFSARSTSKYKNIQSRMRTVTEKMGILKPTSSHNIARLAEIKEKLADLWTKFEDRSESLVEALAKKTSEAGSSGVSASDQQQDSRLDAIKKYEREMIDVVCVFLRIYKDKFPDSSALRAKAVDIVKNKILPQEVQQFSKIVERQNKSWADFRVSDASKKNVKQYLEVKMKSHRPPKM